MSSIGFVDKFYIQITEAITAAATTVYIPDPDYKEILNLDEDYVYVLLRDVEDREIVIIDVSASSKAGGLTVARGQESTVAKVWPRGTTMVRALTAAIAGTFLQKAYYRSIGYDPNGAIAPAFAGEKLLQSTDNTASTRWWISKNATDKLWLRLTLGTGESGDILNKLMILLDMESWSESPIYPPLEQTLDVSGNDRTAISSSTDSGGTYTGTSSPEQDTTTYKVGTASAKTHITDRGDIGYLFAENSGWGSKGATVSGWIYIDPLFNTSTDVFWMSLYYIGNGTSYSVAAGLHDGNGIGASIVLDGAGGTETLYAEYSSTTGNVRSSLTTSFTFGAWTHVAVVLLQDSKQLTAYVDGVLTSTEDVSSFYEDFSSEDDLALVSANNFTTYSTPQASNTNCKTYVDDVRYYNYALTAAEIAALPGF